MRIEDLANKKVRLSPRSITCLDDTGKTCGVITRAVCFTALRPNMQVDFFNQIRQVGLWTNGEASKCYVCDGKLYYIQDLDRLEKLQKYFVGRAGYEIETDKYNQLRDLAKNATSVATVIPCYVL